MSFPENGSNDVPPKDGLSEEGEKKHNEIEPDDTSLPQEDSSEESVISTAFLRLLMIMKMMRETFNIPGIILLRMRFIRIEETSDETQTEGGDFSHTSDDNTAVQNYTGVPNIQLNEANYNSNEETENINNEQSIETNTEAPPPETGKQQQSVETSDKMNGHDVQQTEEVEHKENDDKLIPEVSVTAPLQTEDTTENPKDEKQGVEDSPPLPQEPDYQENEIIPHEETKSNSERKGFFSKIADAVIGVFGSIFG